jgi:hypothetical protein
MIELKMQGNWIALRPLRHKPQSTEGIIVAADWKKPDKFPTMRVVSIGTGVVHCNVGDQVVVKSIEGGEVAMNNEVIALTTDDMIQAVVVGDDPACVAEGMTAEAMVQLAEDARQTMEARRAIETGQNVGIVEALRARRGGKARRH